MSDRPLVIPCGELGDRYACAAEALRFARALGLSRAVAAQVSLAAAELASNAVRHAGGGVLELIAVEVPRPALVVICRDRGPGIADVVSSLQDGYSRGRALGPEDIRRDGLGAGLGAVQRAMDELTFEPATPGTIVTARKWLPSRPSAR